VHGTAVAKLIRGAGGVTNRVRLAQPLVPWSARFVLAARRSSGVRGERALPGRVKVSDGGHLVCRERGKTMSRAEKLRGSL
jgi:hypothetical protein